MSYYAPFYRGNYYNAPQMPPQAMDNQNMYMPNYQQAVPPQTAQPMAQQTVPPTTNDMIWVQGLSGAKAYLVAPNATVTLWDSERKTLYLKSCDNAGMPSMKILDYTERTESAENLPTDNLKVESNTQPTLDGINALNGRFDDILSELNIVKSKISELSAKPNVKNSKKSEE